jgi:hypothetical protein
VLAIPLATAVVPACSLGQGTGNVTGVLDVAACWSGPFDLKPDFFAAVPSCAAGTSSGCAAASSDAMQIRIQNGGDFESFSDGLQILIDDAGQVRGDPLPDGTPRPSLLGHSLVVTLPSGVTPTGVPLKAMPTPSVVHAALYLEHTCRTPNVALYAVDSVTVNPGAIRPEDMCTRPEAGNLPLPCTAPAEAAPSGGPGAGVADASVADAGVAGVGATEAGSPASSATSTIQFTSLFDGDPDESDAQKRLTEGQFEFFLADPREICPGGLGPPPRCRGYLKGSFKFYFQRGRPAQPFP